MNVHHLELFYYVARHGGISAAVRHIPYGIQQPAVSGQMRALEENAGAQLFERSPFKLTPAGERLFAHVRPFFDGLPGLAADLRAAEDSVLRIGGAELVLRDHLPAVLRQMKKDHPRLRLSLRSTGFLSEIEAWLAAGQIDVAFVPVWGRLPAGLRLARLAELPLVMHLPRRSRLASAEELWAARKIAEPLICLPEDTGITRGFLAELRRRRVSWPGRIEATSLDLVTRYVANGDGIGLNVAGAAQALPRGVRALPLAGFPPVPMAAVWRGEASPVVRAMVDGVRRYARAAWPEWAVAG